MKKLFLFLAFVTLAQAQDPIRFRRGNAANRPANFVGEGLFDRDSLTFWITSDSSSGGAGANIPIGGRYLNYGFYTYAVDAQGSDTYVITLPNYHGGSYFAGMTLKFKANTANTGAATINVNGLGAKSITKSGTTALSDNDIVANQVVTLVYDGTQFQLQTGVPEYSAPEDNFVFVPAGVFSHTTSNFAQGLNDTITVFATFLSKSVKLGEIAFTTGNLSGSCAVRTLSAAVYSGAGARLDTTGTVGWPGNGAAAVGVFQGGATVGPGLIYVAFSTYNDGTCTQTFRAPDLSSNTVAAGIFSAQHATKPIVGYATTKLSAGKGWPATLTFARSTTTTVFPYLVLIGTNLD